MSPVILKNMIRKIWMSSGGLFISIPWMEMMTMMGLRSLANARESIFYFISTWGFYYFKRDTSYTGCVTIQGDIRKNHQSWLVRMEMGMLPHSQTLLLMIILEMLCAFVEISYCWKSISIILLPHQATLLHLKRFGNRALHVDLGSDFVIIRNNDLKVPRRRFNHTANIV